MARSATRTPTTAPLPGRIAPQLTQLVDAAPDGDQWLHEIKYDGYRIHARLDRGAVKLLTRAGLDWTHKYPAIAEAVASLPARQAYLDGEDLRKRPLIERKERFRISRTLPHLCTAATMSSARVRHFTTEPAQ